VCGVGRHIPLIAPMGKRNYVYRVWKAYHNPSDLQDWTHVEWTVPHRKAAGSIGIRGVVFGEEKDETPQLTFLFEIEDEEEYQLRWKSMMDGLNGNHH
jgi:hypothetical protein